LSVNYGRKRFPKIDSRSTAATLAAIVISLPSAVLRRCKVQLDAWVLRSPYLAVLTLLYLGHLFAMTYPLFALCRLVLGTLYPAYASYKAVRTKNVREYVSFHIQNTDGQTQIRFCELFWNITYRLNYIYVQKIILKCGKKFQFFRIT
jgi:hypothetical protein